jgi:hypothetical protein
MKVNLKKMGVVIAAFTLAITSLTKPATADTTTLTFAETRQGGVGIKQVEPP